MGKVKNVIIIVILAALVGGYFLYLSNKKVEQKDTTVTAVQNVILRNLETDYPPSPKEVVKYYSDISKCLYNETYTDEQFEQMADKLLGIYDDELVQSNPREQYIKSLRSDVDSFLSNKYSIASYTPSVSTDVEYDTVDGRECAKLYCTYSISIKSGADYVKSKQVFLLRRETDTKHWKIMGFDMVQENNGNQ